MLPHPQKANFKKRPATIATNLKLRSHLKLINPQNKLRLSYFVADFMLRVC